tara:strand:+ start:1691 stop:2020 length:330 start_codon:yes stop_codon:yes gene_type:complete
MIFGGMSKKLIISLFIFSVSIPYLATVLHIFMHPHDHSHETDYSYFEGVNQAEEECTLCYLLANPINNFIFPFVSILIILLYNNFILYKKSKFKFSNQYIIHLRGPPTF